METKFTERLKALATRGGDMAYLLGNWGQINLFMDKLDMQMRKASDKTVCVQLSPLSGSLSLFPQGVESRDVTIGYAHRIRIDYDPADVEAIIDGLRAEAFAFVSRLNGDGFFEPVSDADYSVLYSKTDANYVVVLLSFGLTEAAGHCYL